MAVPPRRLRLDAELVRRGLAPSRERAAQLIADGRVRVSGATATKPATGVTTDVAIVVKESEHGPDYVSRGAHKLAGALAAFAPGGLEVTGRRCLDAGASTGGFTDVLLRAGAAEVVAVDVGLRPARLVAAAGPAGGRARPAERPRLTTDLIGGPVDLVVGDLSFISLALVLDALLGVTRPDGDLALMVKPQFEVGKDRVGKGGVVRDPELRSEAVLGIATAAAERGWGAHGVTVSPLPGPSGNVEFFLWLRRGPATVDEDEITAVVHRGTTPEPL